MKRIITIAAVLLLTSCTVRVYDTRAPVRTVVVVDTVYVSLVKTVAEFIHDFQQMFPGVQTRGFNVVNDNRVEVRIQLGDSTVIRTYVLTKYNAWDLEEK